MVLFVDGMIVLRLVAFYASCNNNAIDGMDLLVWADKMICLFQFPKCKRSWLVS